MAQSSLILCLSVFLFKVIPDSVQESERNSTSISCKHAIIEWAQYNMPSLDICRTACDERDKICVQTSSDLEQNNVSAVCRDSQLSSQEVFLVYQHCQTQSQPCRLEDVPGLLGHIKTTYKCLEADGIQIVDPCEEGSYSVKSVYFLYGYRRVVSTSSDVTCSCLLTKSNSSNYLNVNGVNVYSSKAANNGQPTFTIEHEKLVNISGTFPSQFIITSRTATLSLTLTVNADHRIGRMWASVDEQGNSEFIVNCSHVDGTVPVLASKTSSHSPLTPAAIGVSCLLCVLVAGAIVCLARRCSSAPSMCSPGANKAEFQEMGYLPASFTVNRGAVERGVPDIFLRRSDAGNPCIDTASIATSHDWAVGCADVDEPVEAYLPKVYPFQASNPDGLDRGVVETASNSCPDVFHSPDDLELAETRVLGDARRGHVERTRSLDDVTGYLEAGIVNTHVGENFCPEDIGNSYVNVWSDGDILLKNKPATASDSDLRAVQQKSFLYDLTRTKVISEDFSPVTSAKSTSAIRNKQTKNIHEAARISSDANVNYATLQNIDRNACVKNKTALACMSKSINSRSAGEESGIHVCDTTKPGTRSVTVTPSAEETCAADGEGRDGAKSRTACKRTHREAIVCQNCEGVAGQSARSGLQQDNSRPRRLHYQSVVLDFDSSLAAGQRAAATPGAAHPMTSLTRDCCQTASQELGRRLEAPDGMNQQKYTPGSQPLYDHIHGVGEHAYSSLNIGVRGQVVIDNVYSRSIPHIVG